MRPQFNKPITTFSAGGRLLQVEYAQQGAQRGSTAVGIRCYNCVVLALEQKDTMPLQMEFTAQRIFPVDKNIIMTYSGVTPDARVLLARARSLCRKMRATNGEEPVSVRQVTEYIANVQLRHTQAPDCRPFGVSCLVAGYDWNVKPRLYQTDPSGNYNEYSAMAIGRYGQTAQAYLERALTDDFVPSRHHAIKVAVGALRVVSRPDRRDFEVSLLKRNNHLVRLDQAQVAEYVSRLDETMEE